MKAEVFQTRDGPQVGHCTIKGKVAAQQVFGMFPDRFHRHATGTYIKADNFCQRGWNGLSVEVSLAVLEKPDILKPIIPMTRTAGMVQRPQTKALQEPVSSNAQSCLYVSGNSCVILKLIKSPAPNLHLHLSPTNSYHLVMLNHTPWSTMSLTSLQ